MFFTTIHILFIALNTLENIEKIPENSNVHIKIDTGMHRNGISIDDIEVAILGLLKQKPILQGFHTP